VHACKLATHADVSERVCAGATGYGWGAVPTTFGNSDIFMGVFNG